MAQQKPWERYGAPPAQNTTAPAQAPSVIMGPPKVPDSAEAERLRLSQAAEARAAAAAARDARKDSIAIQRDQIALQNDLNPAGAPKAPQESERTAAFLATRIAGETPILAEIGNAGNPTAGTEIAGWFGKLGNYATPEVRQRARNSQLNILDAALTLGTGAAYNQEQLEAYRQSYFPEVGDTEATIQDKSRRLRILLEAAKVKAGSAAPQIDAAISSIFGREVHSTATEGGALERVTDGVRNYATDTDKEFTALAEAAFRGGADRAELDAIAAKYGRPAFGPDLEKALAARRSGGLIAFSAPQSGVENIGAVRQAIGDVAASPVGALATGAANGVTLGGLDELTGLVNGLTSDQTVEEAIAEADLKKAIIAEQNPKSYLAGNIGGGLVTNVGLTAGLARAGLASAPRVFSPTAVGTDLAEGAISGALESNSNRLAGAGTGAAGGATFGAGGRTLGKAIAPTGGDAVPLYDAGVRPSPGQRFGGAVNLAEEALQSIPFVGSAVRGTRQNARDQFERGAFNQALGELEGAGFTNVKAALPEKMSLGTEPHKFAQTQFDRAYKEARSGMQVVPDGTFAQEFGALQQGIAAGALEEASAKRFENIVRNQVGRRMKNGQLDGDGYKLAQSEISGIVRNIRNNPRGDQELANTLDDFVSILDGAARRSSPAEAVAKLDAADAGYAKLVRIEEAALKRGEAGRFSPAQFDSAVQSAAGGRATRSKAYLRGDALMQEYATAGRSLMDVLPDSGTATRGALATALVGGGSVLGSPSVLAAPVAAALPYAPGIRSVTTSALAPRQSPIANAIGNALSTNRIPFGSTGSILALDQMGF